MKRNNPPFARQFFVRDGQLPLAWLYVGWFAWEDAKKHPEFTINQRVVLPDMHPPENYKWEFINGCIVFGVICGNIDKDYRYAIARELLGAGAVHVRFILPTGEHDSYYLSEDGEEFKIMLSRK